MIGSLVGREATKQAAAIEVHCGDAGHERSFSLAHSVSLLRPSPLEERDGRPSFRPSEPW